MFTKNITRKTSNVLIEDEIKPNELQILRNSLDITTINLKEIGENGFLRIYNNNYETYISEENKIPLDAIMDQYIQLVLSGLGNIGTGHALSVSLVNNLDLKASAGMIKALVSMNSNNGNAKTFYALQSNIDSYGGTIGTAIANRTRLLNYYNEGYSKSDPIMQIAYVNLATIDNSGIESHVSTMESANCFRSDIRNGKFGHINKSIAYRCPSPVNSGIIDEHYGFQMSDQTIETTSGKCFALHITGEAPNLLEGPTTHQKLSMNGKPPVGFQLTPDILKTDYNSKDLNNSEKLAKELNKTNTAINKIRQALINFGLMNNS